MINEVVKLLKEKHLTICSIESLTGGLFASTLTSVSGVSEVYKGSIVSYANEIKQNVVGVKKETIDTYGVISKECAYEMVKCGKEKMNTNIAVSFTGNAGPDVMENKKVGQVYIGIVFDRDINVYELYFNGDRQEIRDQCINFAINKLFEKIK